MKGFKISALLIPAIILFLNYGAYAAEEPGAQFLKICVGSRACAMGEAFVAISDDPSALHWNPAGLAAVNQSEILAMQNFWLLDMSYQYLACSIPFGPGIGGVSLAYTSSGTIKKYENFEELGEFSVFDVSGSVAYGLKRGNFLLGLGLKGIYQKIEEESATALAADIGGIFEPPVPRGLKLGVVCQNLGTRIKFIEEEESLPFCLRAGFSYNINHFIFSADIYKYKNREIKLNLGGEFSLMDSFFLRAGYNSLERVTGGAGLSWRFLKVDYAFSPFNEIDDSHSITLKIKL